MVGIELGAIVAAAPLLSVLAPPAFGIVADAFGLRAGILQLACLGALLTFGSLTAAAALAVPLGFFALLAAALTFALFRSPMTLIADVIALERAPAAGTTYGRVRLCGSVGFLVVVLVAGHYLDPRAAVAFPAAVTVVVFAAWLASLRLPRPPALPLRRGAPGGVWPLLVEHDFQLFLAAVFLGQCGHACYDLCFSLHLFDLGVSQMTIAVAWALGTASEVLLMAYSASVFRAYAPSSLLAVALAGASVRWTAIALVRSPAILLALQPLHAISFGLAWLASVAYASRRFPGHRLATAQGLLLTALAAGNVVGMLVWATAYHRKGGTFVFCAAAVVSACASALGLALGRRHRVAAGSGQPVSGRTG